MAAGSVRAAGGAGHGGGARYAVQFGFLLAGTGVRRGRGALNAPALAVPPHSQRRAGRAEVGPGRHVRAWRAAGHRGQHPTRRARGCGRQRHRLNTPPRAVPRLGQRPGAPGAGGVADGDTCARSSARHACELGRHGPRRTGGGLDRPAGAVPPFGHGKHAPRCPATAGPLRCS